MPVNEKDFMPAASILEKLKSLDANAPYDVMTRAAIVTGRRHDESTTLVNLFTKACKKCWEDFQINMLTYGGPYQIAAPMEDVFKMQDAAREKQKDDASAFFWSGRGDDMRLGILDYMAAKNLTPQAVGLDKAEQDSLELLLPTKAPRDPAAVQPAPIIWPMP